MDIKEQLKDIKTQLRLSMNGAVSQSMREKGLVYKLNFGVELPRIKMIAEGYEKNHDLAQALWKEEIRECKILAGMLQPIETFYPEIADIWVENIRNIEIAELTCMNLFQHLLTCDNDQSWNLEVVKKSLLSLYPVFVGDLDKVAFLVDGYAINEENSVYLHCNFGMNESFNGYYMVNDNGSIVFEPGGYFYRDINLGIIANIRNR